MLATLTPTCLPSPEGRGLVAPCSGRCPSWGTPQTSTWYIHQPIPLDLVDVPWLSSVPPLQPAAVLGHVTQSRVVFLSTIGVFACFPRALLLSEVGLGALNSFTSLVCRELSGDPQHLGTEELKTKRPVVCGAASLWKVHPVIQLNPTRGKGNYRK